MLEHVTVATWQRELAIGLISYGAAHMSAFDAFQRKM
jgi:hypothetical protein